MIIFGFGEVIGGFFMGWFIDRFGAKKATLVNLGIIVLMTLATLLSITIERYNFFSFLMTFLWGIQDGVINIHLQQSLGSQFASHSEPFGVFNLLQGLAVFVFQIIQGSLDKESMLQLNLYTFIVGIIGVWACMVAYKFPYKTDQEIYEQPT